MSKKAKKIVCLGGGTGTSTALSGLKKYPISLSVIVSMFDSGGANKVVRDEFGLLPVSDLRQCFVALAEEGNGLNTLRDLFMYRFHNGNGIKGMTFGNLFMVALSDILGSQRAAIETTGKVLKIKGRVVPVSMTKADLVAVYENGMKIVGESLIDEPEHNGKIRIKRVYLEPEAKAYKAAVREIMNADLVVIGPGDLYTSLIANILVEGIPDAIRKTKAKVVYIMNLMTKYGQTYDFRASDHIEVLEKYLGRNIDFVLVNSKPLPRSSINKYKKKNEKPVLDDLENDYYKVIRRDLLSEKETKKVPGDVLKRSLIRHDSNKLAQEIIKICKL
ncbi:MAG: gluconeogenesis factor YvcK family protein [Candidatus Paceibacterota bacterium]|jgi:uncharacterized cofD-like protein